MNREKVLRSLGGLQSLADIIERSQNFGQDLPSGTTKVWGRQLTASIVEIRQELGIEPPLDESRRAQIACVLAGN